eukprot:scaffold12015_cov14-Tisochrysis_lutea.AAC.2
MQLGWLFGRAGRRREDRVELATAADPNAVWQKVWDEQQTGLIAVRAATAAARVQEEQGLQQQQQEQQGATPTPSQQQEEQQQGGMSGAGGGGIPASTAQAVSAAVALLPIAQQWLVKVGQCCQKSQGNTHTCTHASS